MPIEDVDIATIERLARGTAADTLSPRTKNELLIQLHGSFRRAQRAFGLPTNQ